MLAVGPDDVESVWGPFEDGGLFVAAGEVEDLVAIGADDGEAVFAPGSIGGAADGLDEVKAGSVEVVLQESVAFLVLAAAEQP